MKMFYTALIGFNFRCKVSGVILKCAQKRLKRESSRNFQ